MRREHAGVLRWVEYSLLELVVRSKNRCREL